MDRKQMLVSAIKFQKYYFLTKLDQFGCFCVDNGDKKAFEPCWSKSYWYFYQIPNTALVSKVTQRPIFRHFRKLFSRSIQRNQLGIGNLWVSMYTDLGHLFPATQKENLFKSKSNQFYVTTG